MSAVAVEQSPTTADHIDRALAESTGLIEGRLGGSDDVRADLTAICRAWVTGHITPEVLALHGVVMGSMRRFPELGRTWQEPEQAPIAFPDRTGEALARVWQIQPGPADQPGVIYAGTEPTALFRSEDGGETFSLSTSSSWSWCSRPMATTPRSVAASSSRPVGASCSTQVTSATPSASAAARARATTSS